MHVHTWKWKPSFIPPCTCCIKCCWHIRKLKDMQFCPSGTEAISSHKSQPERWEGDAWGMLAPDCQISGSLCSFPSHGALGPAKREWFFITLGEKFSKIQMTSSNTKPSEGATSMGLSLGKCGRSNLLTLQSYLQSNPSVSKENIYIHTHINIHSYTHTSIHTYLHIFTFLIYPP